ncbi:DNA-binding LacI/PurR family transcriptional regulator [Arthrobacter stackebrandtii]|uniref:DNA-binding LacI/PurR family transcriptional regulator n=1 Tax=Arthrobacter stackebrandtii TaxID=272161 RepID=A0ABS4YVZ4_9MICC|nr:LacI family DNA-binding transcriptional regulator [Arthrobacter stackebrandtii]MBP2412953.1 DNA-binding LacI/PurR family transcriptional regulator [Arthrobacter stackebrandtii]PYH01254.1 LacI family transcriptional regulator [Arthrobacter stackebrandtii]
MGAGIDDVALRAGVSTATVSRALRGLPRVSPETRARVLAAARDLGYVASPSASGLATGRTRTVGVMVPYVDRWYFGHAIEGIDQVLRENGYNLLLFSLGGYSPGRRRSFTESMVRKQIDALLVLTLWLSDEELLQLQRTDIPLMAVGGPVDGCAGVHIDDTAAAAAAVEHLIGLGHRHIGYLHGAAQDEHNFKVPGLRSVAFRNTMVRAGLELRPEWLVPGDFTIADGARAAARIFDLPGDKPTALFCGSDEMALGAMFEAQRRGIRIPQELSVVGIDDHEFSEPAGLTTVAQKPVEQGRAAAAMVLAELNGSPAAVQETIMPFELVVRSTTAPPPKRPA